MLRSQGSGTAWKWHQLDPELAVAVPHVRLTFKCTVIGWSWEVSVLGQVAVVTEIGPGCKPEFVLSPVGLGLGHVILQGALL